MVLKYSLLPARVRLPIVAAMRVSNEDCSPARIHCRDVAPTPTGFAEIVGDDFPIVHASHRVAFGLRKASAEFRFLNAK